MRASGLKKSLSAAILALAAVFASPLARAEAPASTLQRITTTGKIRIGYGDTAPFSYRDADGKVIGYSIDLCKRMSEELKNSLKLPVLEIEYVFRTPSNRVQLLNDGTMDIECNASTNIEERRRNVAFAISHFYVASRYVSLAGNNLRSLEDLKGRSISVARGTINIGQINQANRERKLNLSIVPSDSLQGAFDMVTSGKVSAFAMDDVLLSTMIARSGSPQDYRLSTEMVAEPLPYGFMMRLSDHEFHDAVNAALTKIYASPEMQEIYDRWFNTPIPPDRINLNLPMSERLSQLLKSLQH